MKKGVTLKYLRIVLLITLVFAFQKYVSEISWNVARLFDYASVDNDGTFMTVSVHHIAMALISLGILYILHRWKKVDFKINFKADACGIKYMLIYCVACMVYFIFWYVVFGFILDSVAEYDYELNAVNILGTLVFQLFLSGTEELMFRALPIGCLKAVWGKQGKFADAVILLLTSLLFMVAHIHLDKPLSSQWYGLVFVFIQGLLFGMVYTKTKSIVYPMVMHGVSNFISVGGCYVYMILSHIS